MNSFHITSVDPIIKQTLDTRKTIYNSDQREREVWYYGKTPWVRMFSNAIVARGSKAKAYQEYVAAVNKLNGKQRTEFERRHPTIDNTISNLFDHEVRNQYILTSQNYQDLFKRYNENFRLLPGINRISVSTQGALGSLRKAIVEFTVWSKDELDALEPFYFVPGMSIVLEWGWSITEKQTIVAPIDINQPIPTDDNIRCQIHKNRKRYGGNYDGMQGLIVNFSYSLNSNSGWDCVLEIVSSADIFLSVPIHGTPEKYKKEGEDDEQAVTGDTIAIHLREMIKDAHRYITEGKLKKSPICPAFKNLQNHIFRLTINATSRTPDLDEDKSFIDNAKEEIANFNVQDFTSEAISSIRGTASALFGSPVLGSPTTTETYITFELFVGLLNQFLGLKDGSGKSQLVKLDISGLNGDGLYIGDHPMLGSCDPYVCILFKKPKIKPLPALLASRGTIPVYSGKINDILLNAQMLYSAFKEADDLKGLLQSVLSTVSTACGNYFNFELQEPPENICDHVELRRRTKNTVIITITNTNLTNKVNTVTPYNLAYGDKILRSVGARSKLTEAMKSQALYGMNSARMSETTDTVVTHERFYRLSGKGSDGADVVVRNGTIPFDTIVDIADDYAPPGYSKVEEDEDPRDLLAKAYSKLTEERTDKTVEGATRAMADFFNSQSESSEGDSKTANMILPFEISFGLDGIGGIMWGNVFDISDILPSRVGNMFIYQATIIEHTITAAGWDILVNTIPRFKQ